MGVNIHCFYANDETLRKHFYRVRHAVGILAITKVEYKRIYWKAVWNFRVAQMYSYLGDSEFQWIYWYHSAQCAPLLDTSAALLPKDEQARARLRLAKLVVGLCLAANMSHEEFLTYFHITTIRLMTIRRTTMPARAQNQ